MSERSRITLVETIYHTPARGDAMTSTARFSRWLRSNEQVYGPRRFLAGTSWTPIDLGWFVDEKMSMLVLSNEEGKYLSTQPTEEERTALASRVIELGISPTPRPIDYLPFTYLPPGECLRLPVIDGSILAVRCRAEKAICLITLFPE